jgi:hypothetical protein
LLDGGGKRRLIGVNCPLGAVVEHMSSTNSVFARIRADRPGVVGRQSPIRDARRVLVANDFGGRKEITRCGAVIGGGSSSSDV